jgi:D-2-hydroxyacid dehydrogenase (NADP+)
VGYREWRHSEGNQIAVPQEIVILDKDAQFYAARLKDAFPGLIVHAAMGREEALAYAEPCTAVASLAQEVPAEFVARAHRLKWIAALTTGTDPLDALHLPADVVVTSMRGMHGPQMAELAFLFMMALSRDARGMFDNQKAHVWRRWPQRLLVGKTATLIGVGAISEELAVRCKVFGMRTIGVSSARREARGFDEIWPRSRLNEAAAEADFVVALVPLTTQTRHMIGAAVFAAMKPSAIYINIARGPVTDEAALIAALNNKQIAGAGLDVFEREPLPPDSPLWDMPNVLVTPHIGGMSDIYAQQALPMLIENMRAFLDGRFEDMINIVERRKQA